MADSAPQTTYVGSTTQRSGMKPVPLKGGFKKTAASVATRKRPRPDKSAEPSIGS